MMIVVHAIVGARGLLAFIYVTLSLVCSLIREIIAGVFGLRSRNLRRGIENLVGNEYAQALYDHPLIKGLRKPKGYPSYIKPEIFGAALMEVVARDGAGKHAFELTAAGLGNSVSFPKSVDRRAADASRRGKVVSSSRQQLQRLDQFDLPDPLGPMSMFSPF